MSNEIRQPAWRPVVYLRARGCSQRTWDEVQQALWSKGWHTVKDRTTAWHLARGGMTVVLADFSAEWDGLHADTVVVGRVRARYDDDSSMDLPLVSGGHSPRPERNDPDVLNKLGQKGAWVLDVEALARLVDTELTGALA